MNQKRFEFLASFYEANGITFEKAFECFSSADPSSNATENSALRKRLISFCYKQHRPKDALHIFYSSSASSSLEPFLFQYREYLYEVAKEKEEPEESSIQILVDTVLLFDLFMIKPLRWNCKLVFCISSLSPGLYCQYTLARIRGIVSSSEEEIQTNHLESNGLMNQEKMKTNNEETDLQSSLIAPHQINSQASQQLQSAEERKQFEGCERQIQLMNSFKEQCLTNPQALPKLFNQIIYLCHTCTRLMGTFRVKGSPCARLRLSLYQKVHMEVQEILNSFGLSPLESRM
jgi:hypothetical protein